MTERPHASTNNNKTDRRKQETRDAQYGNGPGYALFKQINCFMKFVPQMGERKTRINKRVIHALETYKGFCMTYCTKGHVTKCLLPFFVQFSVVFFLTWCLGIDSWV